MEEEHKHDHGHSQGHGDEKKNIYGISHLKKRKVHHNFHDKKQESPRDSHESQLHHGMQYIENKKREDERKTQVTGMDEAHEAHHDHRHSYHHDHH